MNEPGNDPAIEHEPHLSRGGFALDPSEAKADRTLEKADRGTTDTDRVEHTVWDEPAVSGKLAGKPPAGDLTYASWLEERIADTTPAFSWLAAFAIAAAAGPWAVVGALLGGSGESVAAIIAVTTFGPVMEETMKIALALWVVEKRPYWFKSAAQIALCAVAGGLAFAVIENLLYLFIYIDDPSPGLVLWRWTICVALHIGCSLIAGMGLMRIWRQTMRHRARPQIADAAAFLVTAMILHGMYNAFAVALHFLEFQF